MRQAAADLNFEQAAELRDKMIELKKNLADAEKYSFDFPMHFASQIWHYLSASRERFTI